MGISMKHQARCASCAVLAAAVVTAVPLLLGSAAQAATLMVGPGQTYATVSAAFAAANDGDTVEVMAGTYINDFPAVETKITLTAIGGRVTMRGTEFIPNEKGILVVDNDVTITGFSFVGAKVTAAAGGNGAGIRYDSGNMVINDCYFANNQEGLLANPWPGATITISNSEFYHNGAASGASSGYTHNLYVGEVATLDIENSYFHGAQVGHEIKSRADTTIVNNTRVVDGPTGTASYGIDLPNGGVATIENNQIEKGPMSENPIMISFGEEGAYATSSLSVTGNLMENDLVSPSVLAVKNASAASATLTGTSVYGLTTSQILSGPGTATGTTWLVIEPVISGTHPWAK